MQHRTRFMHAAILALVTGACGGADTEPLATAAAHPDVAHVRHADNPAVSSWIARLRQATVHMKDTVNAVAAGWDTRVLDCMELPGTGGMGFHFGDIARMGDAVLDELRPELLVYEPQKNGRFQLVAVEYLVPFSAHPFNANDPEDRPSLNGIGFHPNHDLGVWVLHAWIWKNNPAGMFENWNPDVSCAFAPTA